MALYDYTKTKAVAATIGTVDSRKLYELDDRGNNIVQTLVEAPEHKVKIFAESDRGQNNIVDYKNSKNLENAPIPKPVARIISGGG